MPIINRILAVFYAFLFITLLGIAGGVDQNLIDLKCFVFSFIALACIAALGTVLIIEVAYDLFYDKTNKINLLFDRFGLWVKTIRQLLEALR